MNVLSHYYSFYVLLMSVVPVIYYLHRRRRFFIKYLLKIDSIHVAGDTVLLDKHCLCAQCYRCVFVIIDF